MGLLGYRPSELRHNIGACAPSRTTTRLSLLIARLTRRKASAPPVPASAARSAPGRPAKKTSGPAPAGIRGTHLIPGECAQPACISGLKPSASRVSNGRSTLIGMRNDVLVLALDRKAALALNPKAAFGFGSAANSVPLPKPKPWTMREHFVMPSIGSRDVACAERPNVRRFEHFL